MEKNTMEDNSEFSRLLEKAAAFHGHLCAGQMIGVRLAMLGLRLLGITDPLGEDRKKQMVFVEIDRCATDAIMTVTGCRVGRRSMKIIDNGKIAATFYHLETGKAVRIAARPDARERVTAVSANSDDNMAQLAAYTRLSDAELFTVQDVVVSVNPQDMPGPPTDQACCEQCGEMVLDGRHLQRQGHTLCRTCGTPGGGYYTIAPGQEKDARENIPT
ncbi:MAG: FmdE family protein [Desulfopila sp.]